MIQVPNVFIYDELRKFSNYELGKIITFCEMLIKERGKDDNK